MSETWNCPDCGKEMKRIKRRVTYACEDPDCPVIEVRVHRKDVIVIRDSVLTGNERQQ